MKHTFFLAVIFYFSSLSVQAQQRQQISAGYTGLAIENTWLNGFTVKYDHSIGNSPFTAGLVFDFLAEKDVAINRPAIPQSLRFEYLFIGANANHRMFTLGKWQASGGLQVGAARLLYSKPEEQAKPIPIDDHIYWSSRETELEDWIMSIQTSLRIQYNFNDKFGIFFDPRTRLSFSNSDILTRSQLTGFQGDLVFFAKF